MKKLSHTICEIMHLYRNAGNLEHQNCWTCTRIDLGGNNRGENVREIIVKNLGEDVAVNVGKIAKNDTSASAQCCCSIEEAVQALLVLSQINGGTSTPVE